MVRKLVLVFLYASRNLSNKVRWIKRDVSADSMYKRCCNEKAIFEIIEILLSIKVVVISHTNDLDENLIVGKDFYVTCFFWI